MDNENKNKKNQSFFDDGAKMSTHCSRCKCRLENGECPLCGFKAYEPMDQEKLKKIRLIGTGVGLVIFAVIFFLLQGMK